VKVRKDGGYRSALSRFCSGQPSAPGFWIQMRQQELIHGVIDRVRLYQDIAELGQRLIR
jgi:hypothetical protein